jgi:uncharacterized protein YecE (DUF72 family)
MKIYVGTAGWDYNDWVRAFYPPKLEKYRYLPYYSKYFDVVEINSSFYSLPTREMTESWNSRVSDSFCFTLKVWQNISHKINNPQLDLDIDSFIDNIRPLKNKISLLILQFPPWFKRSEKHENHLKYILNSFPKDYRLAIELRDNSWFEKSGSEFIERNKNFFLITTYLQKVKTFFPPSQETYYIRLIGDRELNTFDRVQRSQNESLEHLYTHIKQLRKKSNVHEIFIIVNNHFSGFAPETANQIKQDLNLPIKSFSHQVKLREYLNRK